MEGPCQSFQIVTVAIIFIHTTISTATGWSSLSLSLVYLCYFLILLCPFLIQFTLSIDSWTSASFLYFFSLSFFCLFLFLSRSSSLFHYIRLWSMHSNYLVLVSYHYNHLHYSHNPFPLPSSEEAIWHFDTLKASCCRPSSSKRRLPKRSQKTMS